MRVHMVSLPHFDTIREHCMCAYSERARKLGSLLDGNMILYGGIDNEAECVEHVTVAGEADRKRWFGGPWNTNQVFDQFDPAFQCWQEMNANAIRQIAKRIEPGDAIALIAGRCQAQIADAFAGVTILEPCVGYVGVLPNSYRAFESRAHQAYVHGWERDDQGRPLDTVIPNSFDPNDFVVGVEPGDYLLFLGRMTPRKGLAVVAELAKDHRVLTAGQGDERVAGAAHLGVVRGAERAELLAGAKAVIVATEYLEPFGGVAVEAQLSGSPVLTTDFGAFPETCDDGVTGFRCHSVEGFREAAKSVEYLDRAFIAERARARFSIEAVSPLYAEWLARIAARI